MPVEGDPHGAEELFDVDDVEAEAPSRDEHPLEGGQTDAVDEAQEGSAQDPERPGSG